MDWLNNAQVIMQPYSIKFISLVSGSLYNDNFPIMVVDYTVQQHSVNPRGREEQICDLQPIAGCTK